MVAFSAPGTDGHCNRGDGGGSTGSGGFTLALARDYTQGGRGRGAGQDGSCYSPGPRAAAVASETRGAETGPTHRDRLLSSDGEPTAVRAWLTGTHYSSCLYDEDGRVTSGGRPSVRSRAGGPVGGARRFG